MVFSLAEVGCLSWVAFRIIGVGASSLCRPVPEFHHLTHCCGDAACINTTSTAFLILRTLTVVRPVLVPDGRAKRTYNCAALSLLINIAGLCHRCPFSCDVVGSSYVVLSNVLNFMAECVQCEFKTIGDVVRIECAAC